MTPGSIPIQAVVCDRDGVLAWLDLAAAEAFFAPLLPIGIADLGGRWIAWTQRVGAEHTADQEAAYLRAFWAGLAADLGLGPAAAARLAAFDYTAILRPFPDAAPALHAARARGLRTGVLSNFSLAGLAASLDGLGLGPLVDASWAARAGGAAKPAAAAYQTIARALGVPPRACVYFDDEPDCVAGARAAGMSAYHVDRRAGPATPADGVVRDLTALAAILGTAGVPAPDGR